jgi:hypothetical protein
MLRFIGYSKEELEKMEEREVWRKAFSAIDLVKELLEGLSGGVGGGVAPPPPPNFDPMAVYTDASGPR